VTEAKNKAMRDIRSDLQERADWFRQQIRAEQAEFESLIAQLKREQINRVDDLRAQLEAVTKLLQFASWYHDVRMSAARALALAATAEIAAHQFSQPKTVVGESE
jgi:hypothetical protein